jgi:hypothetical protein
LFEDVGAKGFVGCRDEANASCGFTQAKPRALATGQCDLYCGETQRAGDLRLARPLPARRVF